MVLYCSVCSKPESVMKTLFCCSRCKTPGYLVCGKDCQRQDWERHRREECVVVKIEDGLPKEACTCHRCVAPGTSNDNDDNSNDEEGAGDDDDVSDFFNDLHMVRGRHGVCKIVNGKQVRLTKKELNSIAYPYPRFVHIGQRALFCVSEPKTFYAPDPTKGFTVAQLAAALTKAEEGNVDKHNLISAQDGGWYFEGFGRHKNPHSFIVNWGTNYWSKRCGMFGMGFNHINTRQFQAS